jgi:integrase/recombinase XerC
LTASHSNRTQVRIGRHLYERKAGAKVSYLVIIKKDSKLRSQTLQAKTRTAARDESLAVIAALRKGEPTPSTKAKSGVTFKELSARWIGHERGPSGKRKASTLALREMLLTKHCTAINNKPAASITAVDLRKLKDALLATGLSGSSVRGIFASISCVFRYGAEYGYVETNPAREVTLPDGGRQTEPRYLERHEAEAVINKLDGTFKIVAACCYYAGLRVSESLDLRWRDVDLKVKRINVIDGKTKASIATVPIAPPLFAMLKAHKTTLDPSALVFTTVTGKPQGRRNVLRAVNRASKQVGLWSDEDGREPVGPHDLRHSCAGYHFGRGAKTREVSRLLRHSNVAITQTVYAGLAPAEDEEILDTAAKSWSAVS